MVNKRGIFLIIRGGVFVKKSDREEPMLRINTKKFSAIPLKDIKRESIVITTAKKSSVPGRREG